MTTDNPLLRQFEYPPFGAIRSDYYLPAIEQGIATCLEEIDRIAENPEAPTFENTVEALEFSGHVLDRVLGVFYPLLSADADEELMDISVIVSEKLSDYSSKISMNEKLFERVKRVYDSRFSLGALQRPNSLQLKCLRQFTTSWATMNRCLSAALNFSRNAATSS